MFDLQTCQSTQPDVHRLVSFVVFLKTADLSIPSKPNLLAIQIRLDPLKHCKLRQ